MVFLKIAKLGRGSEHWYCDEYMSSKLDIAVVGAG
jgi:hypothetical protein